ncbi:type III-B CRISPR-associated protein Cas10/Cmr2 [Sulfolobus sp. E5-1-F]|uniref:type III-B CRISPR-associated protein Cas10/Cmr2 n=1 Tax=Saccharolobus sp. E5-1-F TaxID=2663019 RepID=UPI001296862A|nr:type III-B CRISPR-associated protein Cas10/Cmr2 [Sulfolobus sp. E5-1-F]QGA53951.1 type III-B CRISPR-associated protein Cas10/Cmr2 [Sulfolobus sp. E5-1-F]
MLMNFKEKAISLLHDPPHKAYVVTGSLKGQRLCDKFSGLKAHETEALCFAFEAIEGTPLHLDENELKRTFENVRDADHYASAVDRLGLSNLEPEDNKIVLKNIIDPRHFREISRRSIDLQEVMGIAKKLNEYLKMTKDEREAYHVLYTAYELLWIKNELPLTPADTRIPTHTVFDHLYATAMSYNIIFKDFDLYYIDVAGIQNFISKSRKLRDLWASSYLVSLYSWLLIKDFVREYGGDILIIPTARFNPFFYYTVLNEEIKNVNLREKLLDLICSVLYKDVNNCDLKINNYPRFSVIPGTISILLPHNVNIEERKTWEKIVDKVLESSSEIFQRYDIESILDELRRLAKKLPFFVRKNLIPNTKLRSIDENTSFGNIIDDLRKINRSVKVIKTITEIPRVTAPLQSSKNYDYCTMCGENPAILILPREDDNYWNNNQRNRVLVSPSEKLCPWCLTKRLFSIKAHTVIPKLFNSQEEGIQLDFISVGDLASATFKLEIAKNLDKLKDLDKIIQYQHTKSWRLYDELPKRDSWLLFEEATSTYFDDQQLRKSLQNRLKKAPHTYYSIIKGDGDGIGKILTGQLSEVLSISEGTTTEFYLKHALNVKNKQDIIGRLKERPTTFIITPSYLTTISQMLMRIAIRDAEIIYENYGIPVYVGGDDILALAPNEDIKSINPTIEIITKTRENYMGTPQSNHFDKYGLPLFPTTRSYAVYVMHYREPIYWPISQMNELLDKAKDSNWIEIKKQKDTLIVTDGDEESYIPLDLLENFETLKKFIDVKALSKSFIYDVINHEEFLRKKPETFTKFLLKRNSNGKISFNIPDVRREKDENNTPFLINLVKGYKILTR